MQLESEPRHHAKDDADNDDKLYDCISEKQADKKWQATDEMVTAKTLFRFFSYFCEIYTLQIFYNDNHGEFTWNTSASSTYL